ncbi:hypothetical protein PFICI_10848 [Pestalotiopsis fici W106-1]|uniref:Uncharacterized protein n=1 Tax=Pestalotiopsis fici (strain W106-1 / CGMCC3.15140) TaxID=1229662 RepID=W3WT28_PESFW|nr:uncharacterized protein PFICI_10848 [Pestalotiopsis fici W106-1]ETS76974.1 hypothetical protein PFICI_10848 [Pestalotiopsis fici W106-1]
MTVQHGADSRLSFDQETHSWIQRLHEAWSNDGPPSTFAALRDDLLGQVEHLDIRISTLSSLAEIIGFHGHGTDPDSRWNELLATASLFRSRIKGTGRKRKRAYNETNRLRNLALISALWSPAVVFHYGWNEASQVQMNMLRACAATYPRFFVDLLPRLNTVLLARHCQGIQDCRVKTLNEAPLQPHRDLDLITLALAVPNVMAQDQWVTSEDGLVPIDEAGTLLKSARPSHHEIYLLRRDRYGLLTARGEEGAPSSPLDVAIDADPNVYFTSGNPSIPAFQYQASPKNTPSLDVGHRDLRSCPLNVPMTPPVLLPETQHPHSIGTTRSDPAAVRSSTFSSRSPSTEATSITPSTAHMFPSERCDRSHEQGWDALVDVFTPTFASDIDLFNSCDLPDTFEWVTGNSADAPSSNMPSANHRPDLGGRLSHSTSPACPTQDMSVQDLRIESPPVLPSQGPLTVEESLHNRYRDLIMAHIQIAGTGTGDQQNQRNHCTQWLSPSTRWASVWTKPDSKLPRGGAMSRAEADIFYLSSDEALAAGQKGEVLRKPVVVKETFSDSGMHTIQEFATLWRDTKTDASVDTCLLEHRSPAAPHNESLMAILCTVHHDRSFSTADLRNVTRSHRPVFTMLPRFRLFDSLAERVQDAIVGRASEVATERSEGRATARNGSNEEIISRLISLVSRDSTFNALSLAGASSGTRVVAMGGMWLRNLDGVMLCTFVSEETAIAEAEGLAEMGRNWTPNGRHKLFVLEQDDVLFIPPGIRLAYVVHSPTNNLMEGGNLWDSLNIVEVLHAVHWAYTHRLALADPIAEQLPHFLTELEVLVKHQLEYFRGPETEKDFLHLFELAISKLASLGL